MNLYFTSESYLHCLRNAFILHESLPANKYVAKSIEGMECSYFSHGVIRVFEDPNVSKNDSMNRFYVGIQFSSGAHGNPLTDANENDVLPVCLPQQLNGRIPLQQFFDFLTS